MFIKNSILISFILLKFIGFGLAQTTIEEPVDLVQPLVDAANSRWIFFNSATRPFGMVNLSPDMGVEGTWNSGYQYNRDTIRSFSHIHAWQLSGVAVFPTTGSFQGHLGPNVYGSVYSHDDETVRPGYHQVRLRDYDINVELTATTRVGFHRYTYPKSKNSHILIDLSTFLGPSEQKEGFIHKISNTQIQGYILLGATRRRPKDTYVYFAIEFDQPFKQFNTWKNGVPDQGGSQISGPKIGGYVSFKTKREEQRLMKVGISYVSMEQAKLNLDTEIPHWDFDNIVTEARIDWNAWLQKIKVEGSTLVARQRFYTDLWHALQGRRIISDVNGKYCDMTGPQPRTGQIPLNPAGKPKFNHYNSDSFWGAQWTLNTLWHLVYPHVTEEFVNSMLMMYQDGGLIPRGPSGGNYTYVMTGASSTPFIVSAYMKGIRGYDISLAYEGLKKNHLPGGIMSKSGYEHKTTSGGGLHYYMTYGFVPHPLPTPPRGFHEDGSGQTLEYAYQDWTLSQMAKAIGRTEDYNLFIKRAENYQSLWNDEHKSMWIRGKDYKWKEPFDDLRYDNGWVEGNAAQFSWWVPHDVLGLIKLNGGQEAFIKKLDDAFKNAEKHGFVAAKSHDAGESKANRRVGINYGNQPCMQTAFLFNYAGAPWLTQYWSRRVVEEVYSGVSPQFGYSGDEDQGLMGSLAVLMKMGLFSMRGGTGLDPIYELGSPIFDKIEIALDERYYPRTSFSIITENNASSNPYIQSIELNGHKLDKIWILHKKVIEGGTLKLKMGAQPNRDLGSQFEQRPPSMTLVE